MNKSCLLLLFAFCMPCIGFAGISPTSGETVKYINGKLDQFGTNIPSQVHKNCSIKYQRFQLGENNCDAKIHLEMVGACRGETIENFNLMNFKPSGNFLSGKIAFECKTSSACVHGDLGRSMIITLYVNEPDQGLKVRDAVSHLIKICTKKELF
ncbi:MAG: hypothetical protein U1D25_19840 [Hydrogenophaga sp.]|uniref:hypothetical protein n=1 Tax=Hydrogenophaga sp. TaxID=1904254 RepID=UPI00276A6224|nr:hypothetical protein [Hydrogenophaga sp.]MDP2419471.1 hypothetical protein [Hydrogenophaga sp.]MDZ4190343.1 hypothetical protein [Hydrogenophaga sp.]